VNLNETNNNTNEYAENDDDKRRIIPQNFVIYMTLLQLWNK
jgi:hypothetical protein